MNHKIKINVALLSLALFCSSCFAPPSKDNSLTATGSSGSVDSNGRTTGKDELTTNIVSMRLVENTTGSHHQLHLRGAGNQLVKCEIPKESLSLTKPFSERDIVCWLDTEELELYFFGMNLTVQIPANVCEYVSHQQYYFWQYDPVQTTPNGDADTGLISDSVSVDTACKTCNAGACPSSSTPVEPKCRSDYSKDEGPNCDEGSYIARATVWAPYGANGGTGDCAMTVQDKEVKCGGKIASCLAGPGKDEAVDKRGFPARIISIAREGLSEEIKNESPISKNLASVRYLSNYTRVCRVDDYRTDINYLYNRGVDDVNDTGTNRDPLKAAYGVRIQPFYEFLCLNRAKEVLGRIRLQVRQWNRLFDSDNVQYSDHPYIEATGNENTDEPTLGVYNDYLSWDNNDSTDPEVVVSNACPAYSTKLYTFPKAGL